MLLEAYVYVLINLLFSVNVVLGTLENSFVKQRADDLVCGNSSTLTDLGTVGNVIACSRICSSRNECRGFYFNESDGACWGSNQTECQTVTQAAFYRKESHPYPQPNATAAPGCMPGANCTSPVDCGAPPSVQNAVVSEGDTVETTLRTYTCNTGYAVNGTATVTCQAGATWSAVAFSCVPVCPPGWYQIASSCYIVANSPTISVGEIMTFCNNNYPYDSFMVQLETPEENAAVVAFLQNNAASLLCLGLHDPLHTNNWEWMATSEPIGYSAWCPAQPTGGEYYAVLDTSCGLLWKDFDSSLCQPVCELSLP